MGDKKEGNLVYLPVKPQIDNTVGSNTSTFKQNYGESLKDAWFRLHKMHSKDPEPCGEEKLNLYFYYGVEPWYKNALDFASGGSFVLSSPKGASLVIKNLFGTNVGKMREVEDMNTLLTSVRKRIEDCAKRLPGKRNIDHLELFSKYIIHELEDKMALIVHKLDSCEEELKREDKTLKAQKEGYFVLVTYLKLLLLLNTCLRQILNIMFLRSLGIKRRKAMKLG